MNHSIKVLIHTTHGPKSTIDNKNNNSNDRNIVHVAKDKTNWTFHHVLDNYCHVLQNTKGSGRWFLFNDSNNSTDPHTLKTWLLNNPSPSWSPSWPSSPQNKSYLSTLQPFPFPYTKDEESFCDKFHDFPEFEHTNPTSKDQSIPLQVYIPISTIITSCPSLISISKKNEYISSANRNGIKKDSCKKIQIPSRSEKTVYPILYNSDKLHYEIQLSKTIPISLHTKGQRGFFVIPLTHQPFPFVSPPTWENPPPNCSLDPKSQDGIKTIVPELNHLFLIKWTQDRLHKFWDCLQVSCTSNAFGFMSAFFLDDQPPKSALANPNTILNSFPSSSSQFLFFKQSPSHPLAFGAHVRVWLDSEKATDFRLYLNTLFSNGHFMKSVKLLFCNERGQPCAVLQ